MYRTLTDDLSRLAYVADVEAEELRGLKSVAVLQACKSLRNVVARGGWAHSFAERSCRDD